MIKLLPRWHTFPDPMPEGIVERLIERNPIPEHEILDVLLEIFDEFHPGMFVKVKDGLLRGKVGEVTSVRSKLLEITFLRQQGNLHAIWIAKEAVRPVGE